MPNYTTITLEQDLQSLKPQIEVARDMGTYAAQSGNWDRDVLSTVKTQHVLACRNTDTYINVVSSTRDTCKDILRSITDTLKKKNLVPKDVESVKDSVNAINELLNTLDTEKDDYNKAMAKGYRGGWPALAREMLSDPNDINPFQADRKAAIDNSVATTVGLTKRCEEYRTRGAEYLKEAIQRDKQSKVEANELMKEVDEIETKLNAGKQEIDDLIFSCNRQKEQLLEFSEKKVTTDEDVEQATMCKDKVAAIAKQCRGKLKTLKIVYESLVKRLESAGDSWKGVSKDKLKAAKKTWDEIETMVENFDKVEKEAVKQFKKVEKSVVKK